MAKHSQHLPAVLIIGGLDPEGRAGMMADRETVLAHGCHPVLLRTAFTAKTSQCSTSSRALDAHQFLDEYHTAVAGFDIAAITVGWVPNLEIVQALYNLLKQHRVPIIWNLAFDSRTEGGAVSAEVKEYLIRTLLPEITLLTLNAAELTQLTQEDCPTRASQRLLNVGLKACLVKSWRGDGQYATDYFKASNTEFYCYTDKQDKNARGAGCVLASSIACYMATNHDIRDAIVLAKAYVTKGIRLASQQQSSYVVTYHNTDLELDDIPKLTYSEKLIGQKFSFPPCPQRLGIYPIVDRSDWVKKLMHEGIKTIQLRIKNLSDEQKHREIQQAILHCNDAVAFFVNDDWQIAIKHKAYGVHLGQEDLHDANLIEIEQAGLRLGVSTHSYWELARALAISPSYIALGPIFETKSKLMPWVPQGVERVEQWVQLLGKAYPLVAIGGINLERAKQLHRTGVSSVAMISAITKAVDYKKTIRELLAFWT